MIGINNYITVKSGYKKVADLMPDDILYDPVKKSESRIRTLSFPYLSNIYRIIVPKLHPIECTNDVLILTDAGFIKPQDLCSKCRVYTPMGFLFVLNSVPISEQVLVRDIVAEDKSFLMLLNGVYILIEDK